MSDKFFVQHFVIRARDGQYVGPLGFTPKIERAVFFPSHRAALEKCNQMSNVLDGGAILPYSPTPAAGGPVTATEAPGTMEGGPESPDAPSGAGKAGNAN